VAGIVTTWRREDADDARRFVQVRLSGEGIERVYFLDRTEVVHRLKRNHQELRLGRPLVAGLALETWIAHERADATSTPEVYRANEVLDQDQGDPIPLGDLPSPIVDVMDTRDRGRLGLGLVVDTRQGTGLRQRGLWGRLSVEAVLGDAADFGVGRAELRGYLPMGHLLLAGRIQGAATDAAAPFYDRFYLGGLYSVRGYPSQALSRPEGDLRQLTGSIELRAPMIGPPENPRLTAVAFLDGGLGWSAGSPDPEDDGGAGIGWGVRWRLPLVNQVGLDVGRPLGDSPVEEAFHVNLSLGWSF
jgi:outer membrane protein assembly factor BamA